MNLGLQQFLRGTFKLFTTPLFQVGGTFVSISLIVQLILTLLIVVFLTHALKSLLKKWLLIRIGNDEGNREAIATIISYAVGTLGLLIVLQSTGFNLSSLTVVAGALSVGVGFGLQNITRDFISFQEDDPGDAFYIILSGSVEVFVEKLNKHLNTLQAGEFFGELSLMLGIPRTATVRALEETILFVINNKGFEKVLQEQPELAEVIVKELEKHQEELTERQKQLRQLGLMDASEDDTNPIVWVRKRLKKLFRF